MAAEAVLKINEAEEKGGVIIKNANAEAKEIIKKAESDAAIKRKSIIEESYKAKEQIIQKAIRKANDDCTELVRQGEKEKEAMLNIDKSKLEQAANLVFERIVNFKWQS